MAAALLCCAGIADAMQTDIIGPPSSVRFGSSVTVLPNGNIVVTDPDWLSGVGAVYLYSPGGTLISTLTGAQSSDNVGSYGVVVLANGNYVIVSSFWSSASAAYAGAVTWGSASAGVSGTVSAANSLVGTTANDHVGNTGVAALGNGHYVVGSSSWDNGGAIDAGAATWGNGNSGTKGAISASNSLVGTSSNDGVGASITVLSNSHYVVNSPAWDNSVLGVTNVGAVTWSNGGGGTVGTVSATNSLIGASPDDLIGNYGVTALANGHYVVASAFWNNSANSHAGAVTWGNGNTGTTGVVSTINSLVGTGSDNLVGSLGVRALGNGHYVVLSPDWDTAGANDAGAVTWRNGDAAAPALVSAANSLVGTTANDQVGTGVRPLSNGHYVVLSSSWHNGAAAYAGAATWGNGNGGTVGAVSPSNSLVGTSTNDSVGNAGAVALSNGNYVVSSPYWDGFNAPEAGAATWGNGLGGVTGAISSANSLIGNTSNDNVGGHITALTDGNYVVTSRDPHDGTGPDAGAVTWANGSTGLSGYVSVSNSAKGPQPYDMIGDNGVVALKNGRYVIVSPYWHLGGAAEVGAITWGKGSTGSSGSLQAVSAANSLIGTTGGDRAGGGGVTALGNGDYVVQTVRWNNGMNSDAGAITLARGTSPLVASINTDNSVLGVAAFGGERMVFAHDATRDQLVVGRPYDNKVTIFKLDLLFRDGFD